MQYLGKKIIDHVGNYDPNSPGRFGFQAAGMVIGDIAQGFGGFTNPPFRCWLISGLSLSAFDIVDGETFKNCAISFMVVILFILTGFQAVVLI